MAPRVALPRVAVLVGACVQNALCTGVLFGWSALAPPLLKEPGVDETFLHHAYVLATSVNMMAPMAAGPLLDMAGPRACAVACTFVVASGFAVYGASGLVATIGGEGANRACIMVSAGLIGLGGPGVQNALFNLSNLFPASRALALSLISSSIGGSFVVFEVLVRASEALGSSLPAAFRTYAVVLYACCAASAAVLPDSPVEAVEAVEAAAHASAEQATPTTRPVHRPRRRRPADHRLSAAGRVGLGAERPTSFIQRHRTTARPGLRASEDEGGGHCSSPALSSASPAPPRPPFSSDEITAPLLGSSDAAERGLRPAGSLVGAPLWAQLTSLPFAVTVGCFCVGSFFYNFFVGSVAEQATSIYGGDAARGRSAVSTFLALSPTGALLNTALGALADRVGFDSVRSLSLAALGLSGLALAAPAPPGPALAASCSCFLVGGSALFTHLFGSLASDFGFQFYGLLAGCASAAGGAVSLLLPAALAFAHAHGFHVLGAVQAAVCAATWAIAACAHPGRARQVPPGKRTGPASSSSVQRAALHPVPSLVVPAADAEMGEETSPVSPLVQRLWAAVVAAGRPPEGPVADEAVLGDGRPGAGGRARQRAFSTGDIRTSALERVRRRPDIFPTTDDILVIDGAHPHYSCRQLGFVWQAAPSRGEGPWRAVGPAPGAPPGCRDA